MSRTRLEQIIQELDLYPEERKLTTVESLVGLMRNSIEVQVLSGR